MNDCRTIRHSKSQTEAVLPCRVQALSNASLIGQKYFQYRTIEEYTKTDSTSLIGTQRRRNDLVIYVWIQTGSATVDRDRFLSAGVGDCCLLGIIRTNPKTQTAVCRLLERQLYVEL